jgi:two-component system phosphate regulon sensor histidine kinase PhoR
LKLDAVHSSTQVDKLHLTNVFFNLIDNAIKYNQNNPVISIATSTQNKEIKIDIQDNGVGIRQEEFKKIFQRFYRVPTGNLHDVKGFGLGLSYVKLIVEAHGGKISVSSKPGEGSCFTIIIPLA